MRILLAVVLLLYPLSLAAQPARTITKAEVRTDPPSRTHRRLRDATWDMFRQGDMRREREPGLPLDTVWLDTRPRGTHVPSLCRYDVAVVEFAPVDHRLRGPDTRTRAIGITASSRFRFVAPPAGGFRQVADHRRALNQSECLGIDPRRQAFFQADGEELATDAFFAFVALQRALGAGAATPLECNRFPLDTRTCTQIILGFTAEEIGEVGQCDDPDPGLACFRLTLFDRQLTIVVTSGYGLHPRPFGEVVRAGLDSLIVLIHERPD